MPGGRTKEILHTAWFGQAGPLGRHRVCRGDRKNHPILPGAWYFAIKDGLEEKSYCLVCARRILERGHSTLEKLFSELEEAER